MPFIVRRSSAAFVAACIVFLAGCAHGPEHRVGVPIDSRPTPQQPDTSGQVAGATHAPAATPQTVHSRESHIASDTTAVHEALARCAGRNLQPDQQGVVDSVTDLLMQVRAAVAGTDLAKAQSLARQARQLSTSLTCR